VVLKALKNLLPDRRFQRAVATHADTFAIRWISQQYAWLRCRCLDFLRFDLFQRHFKTDARFIQIIARHDDHIAGNIAAENRRFSGQRIWLRGGFDSSPRISIKLMKFFKTKFAF
jgi:hypothetical protein